MRPIEAEIKELLFYSALSGRFFRKTSTGGERVGTEMGCIVKRKTNKYLVISIRDKSYYAHRLAWLYIHGEWPSEQIDHIDGNGLNNKIDNLRVVSNADNSKNRRITKINTSGVVGVYWNRLLSKWESRIGGCVKDYIGVFDEKWDAICARKSAEFKLKFHPNHGELR